jgi:hypothetical protein
VYYHETSGIYSRGGLPPVLVLGSFYSFIILYICIYNNTVVEFEKNKVNIIQEVGRCGAWMVTDEALRIQAV